MGLSPFKTCGTNCNASAPNPDPSRWTLLEKAEFEHGYVLKVRYRDATNFEGVKVMVYRGQYQHVDYLDPHFEDDPYAPIARFAPTEEGWKMALNLAENLSI